VYEWEKVDGYADLTGACVAFACGEGEAPITTCESRAALRAVFAGYDAAASGMTQTVRASTGGSRIDRTSTDRTRIDN
jgi:hypothetical protein